ncbi:MAG: hypothetical protein ACKJSG_16905, partial [Lentisphaeria bacterium]
MKKMYARLQRREKIIGRSTRMITMLFSVVALLAITSSKMAAQTLTISQDRTERDINGNGVIYQRALEAMESDPTGVFAGIPINERMNVAVFVKLDLVSTGGPVTNIQWTVPGDVIKDTTIISNTATGAGYRTQCEEVILLPGDLQQSSIQFLWKDTGSRTVTLNATVGGTPLVATKNFEVRRNPKAEIFWVTGFGNNPSSDPGQVRDNLMSEHRWWHRIEPLEPAGEFFRFHRGFIQKGNCFRAIFGYEPVKVYATAPNYLPENTATYTSDHVGTAGGGSGVVIEPRHAIPSGIYAMPDKFTLAGDGTTKLEDYSHENALSAAIISYHNNHHSELCSFGDFLRIDVTPADPIFHRFHWMLTKVHELWQLTQLGKPGGGITVPADTPLGATVYYPETAMEIPATAAEGTVQFCTPASGSFFLTGTTYVNCTLKDVELLNPDPNAPALGGITKSITFPVTVTPQGSLNTGPVDVYFLVDLSGSFYDDLPLFKSEVAGTGGIIDDLLAINPDIKFGVGSYEDYPISPFGWAGSGDVAYRRNIDLTLNASNVKATINGLSLRSGGDLPEGQLPALYQAASGVGQVVPGHPQADIPANQNANFDDFRNGQPVKKIFLLWTDADFHNPGDAGSIPYPGPTFQQTVDAVLALDPPKVLGLSSGGGGLEDLRTMARMTGALATSIGCDCNDDGRIDIKPGEPLVCVIPESGEGVGAAIKGLLLAATGARTCDEIAIDVFDAFCLSPNKQTTSVRELKDNYKAIARGLVSATPIINDGTVGSRNTNENEECLVRIAAVLDDVIGYEDEQESSEPEPEEEPELEWADTGHMTLDGRLITGGHNQLYALEVDYLDIDANSNYVYALMTLVSHLQNGEISTGQMRWLYERAIMSAVPIDIIAEYMAFEHRKANLEDHVVGSGGDSIARVLLYDVTQMIINGHLYDESPKSHRAYDALVDQAAQQLGISGEVSAQIRDIVDEELAVLGDKKEIFWAETPYAPPILIDTTPDEEWTTGGGHMTVDGRLVVGGHTQLYALDVDYLAIEAYSNYLYPLMAMVSHLQNGEIPPGQMGWLKERAYMSAVPRDIIEEYIAFEHRTANLEDYMIGSNGDSIARVLLYDVIQMITHGDLYDNNQRARSAYHGLLSKAAEQLGVPEDVSRKIQRVIDQEVYLFHKKKAVFWSETPYVPPGTVVVPPDDVDEPADTVVVPPDTVVVPPDDIVTQPEPNRGNNQPVIDKVTLTPNPYQKEPGAPCDSPIEASAAVSDADGDDVTVIYQWFVNGFMVTGELVGSILAPSNFVDRDIVKCVAIPYDGTDYGYGVSESVNIVCPLPDHHLFGPNPQPPFDDHDGPGHDHDHGDHDHGDHDDQDDQDDQDD